MTGAAQLLRQLRHRADAQKPCEDQPAGSGVPRYEDETDVFILSGAEDLVPVETSPNVTRYRPRTEGLFALIERHANGFGYWQVKSKDGLLSTYGTDDASADWSNTAVIADPQNRLRVFAWKLTRTIDPFGNEIRYGYERDQGRDGERLWDQLYLRTIEYADHGPDSAKRFLVSVTFEYEENRPDPFSDYRAGFEIRTRRRCREIIVRNHADQTRRVRSYRFDYLDDLIITREVRAELASLNSVSLLSRVVVTGHDDEQSDPARREQQLPPLTFGYTRFRPQTRRLAAVQGADLPATSLSNRNLELVDLFGRGLPDILEMNGAVR